MPEVISSKLAELAKRLAEIKNSIAELDKEKKTFADEEEQVEAELLKYMEADDLKTFRLDGIGIFTNVLRSYPRAVDNEKAIEWLDGAGHPDVAPRTIGKARLKELFTILQENDQPLPPKEIIDVYRESGIKFTARPA